MGEGSFDAPSFSNFLKLLSSDQRRRVVSIIYKNGQRRALTRILALEDSKAQEYFQKWREYEENKRSDEEQPTYDTNTSQIPPCASDSENEDNSDNPDKWTPKIRDDFFEGRMDFLNDLNLGDEQKIPVEVILTDKDIELEDKLKMLECVKLDNETYAKIENFLKPVDFIALMAENNKKLAALFLKKKKFDSLGRLMVLESETCQKEFEKFMKKQEGQHAPVEKPTDFIELMGEANKKLAAFFLKQKKFGSVARLVTTESEECQKVFREFMKHKEGQSAPTQEFSTERIPHSPNIASDFFNRFPKCLNILILGEAGVGKSTFINGLANYLKYNNMHEAKSQGVEILIGSHFIHMDVDYNQMRIECDPTIEIEEKNEDTAEKPSTQSPKAYQFDWGPSENRKTIRIIDTPGVGDTRGLEQEQMNFAKILPFLADYPEIHAILILLKPNETRLTVTYRYCINELLTHLHVSASKNILFCFTNTRTTLYRPGETLPTLESHLDQLYKQRNIKIPLSRDTIFCFDNESFRFLCAWKQGATFTDKEIEDFNTSWKNTAEETFRLFKRISELPVHRTEETLSINNIRSVILAMARPLAEIAKNQMINAQLIDEKVKEIEDLILPQGLKKPKRRKKNRKAKEKRKRR